MTSKKPSSIPILSFFTGGGLLDLGLECAGFAVAWTNENNAAFADMYEAAMTSWRRSHGDEGQEAVVNCRSSITTLAAARVLREAFPSGKPQLFGAVGGPPCPDFSNGGTHAGGQGKGGKLSKVFVDMILRLRPHFFIIENVSGLHRIRKHRRFLDDQVAALRQNGGYAVDMSVLNALELGVPQNRERLFVVGVRKRIAAKVVGRRLKPREANWFPWPRVARYVGARKLPWPHTSPFGKSPPKPDAVPLELTAYPALIGDGDPELEANGQEHFNSYSKKFWQRDEGDVSAKSFKRLHRYRYSPTVWYGNQEVHLHPWKPRRLSVREALRIQSVPDDYALPKDCSLSAKFKLICNGVPCRMAELLGVELRKFLRQGTAEV